MAYWAKHGEADADAFRGRCMISGRDAAIARLHEPKIKGVRGTQSCGALLVSFNDAAYESFGKTQSYNAPVGTELVFKYTNALNYLLGREDRRVFLGDATVVFWAQRPTALENVVSDLLGNPPPPAGEPPPEDRERRRQIRLFLTQLRDGSADHEALESETRTPFFILGLSPNASRVAVRFWMDSSVGQVKRHLAAHLRDVELVGLHVEDPPPTVRRLVQATGRAETDPTSRFKGYDSESVSPLLAGALARAVLTGGPYPQMLLGALLNRLRADGVIRHERIAAIKACLVRNARLSGQPKEVPVALDPNRSDAPYVIGRIFRALGEDPGRQRRRWPQRHHQGPLFLRRQHHARPGVPPIRCAWPNITWPNWRPGPKSSLSVNSGNPGQARWVCHPL